MTDSAAATNRREFETRAGELPMTTNTTDHLQALRQQVADVLERHARDHDDIDHDLGSVWGFTETETIDKCLKCDVDWPCDATNMARQMTTLLGGLNTYANLIKEIRPYLMRNTETTVDMYIDSVNAAIASAAQEQENG